MYAGVLFIHSYVRWAVVLLGAAAWARAVSGRGSAGDGREAAVTRWFHRAFDVQVLLGLLLHLGLSPITRAAFGDIGGAMGQTILRFYTIEHPVGMIGALVFAKIGRVRARRAPAARARRTEIIFYGIAMLLILASVPWPFMPAGRPYLRW